MLVTLTAGIETSKHQLDDILKRVEILEEEQKQRESLRNEAPVVHKSVSVSKLEDSNARQSIPEVGREYYVLHTSLTIPGLAVFSTLSLSSSLP